MYGVSKTSISNWINELVKNEYITLIGEDVSEKLKSKKLYGLGYGEEVCEWCGCYTAVLHKHHYPIPKSKGGTETVNICPNCHHEFHYSQRCIKLNLSEKEIQKMKETLNSTNNVGNFPTLSNEIPTCPNNNTIYIKDIVEIVDYLNLKCNTKYKASTNKTQSMIRARIKEKFTVADFKKVIDIKAAEWGNDEKMKKYLRPETLFGTKFESYLNQAQVTNSYIPQTKQKEIDYNERQKSEAFYESLRQRDLEEAEKIKASMSEEEYKAYVQSWTADL